MSVYFQRALLGSKAQTKSHLFILDNRYGRERNTCIYGGPAKDEIRIASVLKLASQTRLSASIFCTSLLIYGEKEGRGQEDGVRLWGDQMHSSRYCSVGDNMERSRTGSGYRKSGRRQDTQRGVITVGPAAYTYIFGLTSRWGRKGSERVG